MSTTSVPSAGGRQERSRGELLVEGCGFLFGFRVGFRGQELFVARGLRVLARDFVGSPLRTGSALGVRSLDSLLFFLAFEEGWILSACQGDLRMWGFVRVGTGFGRDRGSGHVRDGAPSAFVAPVSPVAVRGAT